MRYQPGTRIKGTTSKHGGLQHTVIGNTPTAYRLQAETGRCKGRIHYLHIPLFDRYFEPCK